MMCGVVGCTAASPRAAAVSATPKARWPTITLKHGGAQELATRRQLEHLFTQYDVTPWLFTSVLEIDDEATPHSHPVLTLSTRHVQDDLLLLATFVHEQSHWYFEARPDATHAAMAELEASFPDLPVGFPDGAVDHGSNYLHLCVIPFEYQGLRRLVGELQARQVLEFWTGDHYRVLYRTVLDHYRQIMTVVRSHGLEPPPASPL